MPKKTQEEKPSNLYILVGKYNGSVNFEIIDSSNVLAKMEEVLEAEKGDLSDHKMFVMNGASGEMSVI